MGCSFGIQSRGRGCPYSLKVPCLTCLQMLHAVIRAKFSVGPGSDKVHSGEYEVFDTRNDAFMLKDSDLPVLLPGMSIKMTIVIGQYAGSNRCPRYGCLSSISKNESSSPRRTWTWYSIMNIASNRLSYADVPIQ